MKRFRNAFPVVVGVLAATAASARADLSNRYYMPFGERAAMMGNAGITSPYGEAAFYNPANLTRIGHPSLSVSGSTYLRYDLSADPILVLQGEDQPFSASGFVAIPSTVTSTYKAGEFWLSTAVLVPEAIEFKNRSTFRSTDLAVTLLQQRSVESLWLGGSIARELAPGLSVGVSVFVQNESESTFNFVRVQNGFMPIMSVREVTTNEDVSVWNLTGILGVHYQASEMLGIGLRVHSPTVKLTGSADVYESTLQAGMNAAAVESEVEDVNVSRPAPADLGVGFSIRPTPRVELVADVSLQLPGTFTTLDDPMLGVREVEVELAPRAGIGAEIEVGSKKWLRLGAMYNASALATPASDADAPSDTYYGATLGFSFQKERTVTSIGLFGLQSNTAFFVEGADPQRRSDARVRLYGGLLAVSYRL